MAKDYPRNSWTQGSGGIALHQAHTIGLSQDFQNSSGEEIHVLANPVSSRIIINYMGLN